MGHNACIEEGMLQEVEFGGDGQRLLTVVLQ